MSDELLHVFEHAQREWLSDGRKVVQEFPERSVVFQVVEQCPNWHTRADKNGRSPEDVGIGMDAWNLVLHGTTSEWHALSIRPAWLDHRFGVASVG
jgi:hypothetical protein